MKSMAEQVCQRILGYPDALVRKLRFLGTYLLFLGFVFAPLCGESIRACRPQVLNGPIAVGRAAQSAAEVPDQWVITDANFSANWHALCDGRLLASGFKRLTVVEVIATNGAPFFVATGGRGALIATVDPLVAINTKVTVVEYLNAQLNYYFLTSRDNEKALLDTAPGWARTGATFNMLGYPNLWCVATYASTSTRSPSSRKVALAAAISTASTPPTSRCCNR